MIAVNITSMKAKLSHYLNQAISENEKIIIYNHNIAIAEVKPIIEDKLQKKKISKKRKLGLYKENVELPEDFNDSCSEIENMFYNN